MENTEPYQSKIPEAMIKQIDDLIISGELVHIILHNQSGCLGRIIKRYQLDERQFISVLVEQGIIKRNEENIANIDIIDITLLNPDRNI
jgi:hypothetical protein